MGRIVVSRRAVSWGAVQYCAAFYVPPGALGFGIELPFAPAADVFVRRYCGSAEYSLKGATVLDPGQTTDWNYVYWGAGANKMFISSAVSTAGFHLLTSHVYAPPTMLLPAGWYRLDTVGGPVGGATTCYVVYSVETQSMPDRG